MSNGTSTIREASALLVRLIEWSSSIATRAVTASWVYFSECSCGWLGGDHRTEAPAATEGREHERDPKPPPPEAWSPRPAA